MQDRWLFIVNPAAGSGRGGVGWNPILAELRKAGLEPEIRHSEHCGHIEQLVGRAADGGHRRIATYGGDGSLSATVNAVMNQQACDPRDFLLAHYPAGTGNDWCRMFSVPDRPRQWAQMIKTDMQFGHDVGVIDLMRDGHPARHFFINIAGVAYEAYCATVLEDARGKTGLLSGKLFYDYLILKGLFNYKKPILRLQYDGTERQERMFSISIGICRYNGGAMMPTPYADPADGLLDVTAFADMPILKVLQDYPKMRKGTIYTNPKVNGFRTERVSIDGVEKPDFVEADGEYVGKTPATFTIRKQALRFVIGRVPEQSRQLFES